MSEHPADHPAMHVQTDTMQASANAEKPRNPLRWTLAGIALGAVLLYAATRQVDAAALLDTLRRVDPGWAAILVAVQFTFVAIKAWRWGLLLRFAPGVRFGHLHAAVYAGLAANYVVAHLGEFLRSMTVARRQRVSIGAVLASVFVERALDFIALLLILAIVATLSVQMPDLVRTAGLLIGVVVVVAVAGLYLLLDPPDWLEWLARAASRMLPPRVIDWVGVQLQRFQVGLASLRDLRLMMLAVLVSVGQWSLVVGLMWGSAYAIGTSVSLDAAAITFVLIVVGLTLPNSPLQLGTNQLAFAIGMATDGVPATTAVAASFVFTAFAILPTLLVGAVFLVQRRYIESWRLR